MYRLSQVFTVSVYRLSQVFTVSTYRLSQDVFTASIYRLSQVFQAHRLVLTMASPVFEAMLFGGMAEKAPIKVLDVSPDAFRSLML